MVYDQAQSARLGQRTPVESTYVQMVDDEDLIEAAYPGQLVYQNSSQQLLIWSEDDHAWAPVVGGVPGHLTFVGPEPPDPADNDAISVGDTWYDDNDPAGLVQYVQVNDPPTLDGWVAVDPNLPDEWPGTLPMTRVTYGIIQAGAVIGSKLRTPGNPGDPGVEIDSSGIQIIGDTDDLTTTMTPGFTQFKGEAELTDTVVKGKATLRAPAGTEVSRGGLVRLASGVTAPGAAPAFNVDWAPVPLTGYNFTTQFIYDMQWDSTLSRWLVVTDGTGVGDTQPTARVLKFTTAGVFDGVLGNTFGHATGNVIAGTRVPSGATPDNFYLYNASSSGPLTLRSTAATPGAPAITVIPFGSLTPQAATWDGTNICVGELVWPSTLKVRVSKFNPYATAGSNLVANPNFNANVNNWQIIGPSFAWISGAQVIEGSHSLQFGSETTSVAVASTDQTLHVTPRKRYTASCVIKRTSGSGGVVTFRLVWLDSGGGVISNVDTTVTASATAQTMTISTTAPVNADQASLQVRLPKTVTAQFVLDTVSMATSAGLNYVSFDDLTFDSTVSFVAAMYIGSGDFGTKHYVVAGTNATGKPATVFPDSTKAEDINKTYPLPPQTTSGIGYGPDGNFWTLGSDAVLYRHEGGNNFTTASPSWWAAYSWKDTSANETLIGPSVGFTMLRRARLTITSATILVTGTGDPTSAGVYLARGSATPLHYNLDTTGTVAVITAANFSGAAPLSTPLGFATSNPAEVFSEGQVGGSPTIQLWGDGHGRLGEASWDALGNWTPSFGGGGSGVTYAPVTMRRTTNSTTVIPNTTTTYPTWPTAQENIGGITYNSSTKEWTVPAAGTYLLAMGAEFGPPGSGMTGVRREVVIYVNGVQIAQCDSVASGNNLSMGTGIATSKQLAIGDLVKFAVFHNAGAGSTCALSGDPTDNWASITKIDGIQGPPGPVGGLTGTAGGDLTGTYPNPTLITLTFTFAVGSTSWSCTHNLGKLGVKVFCTDSSGSEQRGDVVHVDANHVTVNWVSPTTGIAYISP